MGSSDLGAAESPCSRGCAGPGRGGSRSVKIISQQYPANTYKTRYCRLTDVDPKPSQTCLNPKWPMTANVQHSETWGVPRTGPYANELRPPQLLVTSNENLLAGRVCFGVSALCFGNTRSCNSSHAQKSIQRSCPRKSSDKGHLVCARKSRKLPEGSVPALCAAARDGGSWPEEGLGFILGFRV